MMVCVIAFKGCCLIPRCVFYCCILLIDGAGLTRGVLMIGKEIERSWALNPRLGFCGAVVLEYGYGFL
jgi:hypothetical protein